MGPDPVTFAPPPEGYVDAAPQQTAQPPVAPAPVAEEAAPPPPQGFLEAPPPEGFTASNPVAPEKRTQSDEKTNTEVPGFWSAVGSAFGRGMVQRTMDDIAGVKVVLPEGVGGKSLEQQYQESLVDPATKDELDGLLAKRVNEGWSDPKWWGAQVAHGAGGMAPGLATAVAVRNLPIGFGIEGGVGALVPAYKKARAEGLSPEDATVRAIIDSGISAATAAAMGLAPNISVFGKTTVGMSTAVGETVAQTLKRPVMEMLAQLGLVQPSLAVTGEIVKDLSHGEAPDPWGLATTFVVGAAQGVPIVGAHSAMPAVRALRNKATPTPLPALTSPRQVINTTEGGPPPPEGFVAREEDVTPREDRVFFSQARKVLEEKMPENAPAHQVMGILRSGGVKNEEIQDLGLPAYLADPTGKVNKNDLLAHVDSESVRLEEVQRDSPPLNTLKNFSIEMEQKYGPDWMNLMDPGEDAHWSALQQDVSVYRSQNRPPEYPEQVLPGEHTNYREFVIKTPAPPLDETMIEQKAKENFEYNNKFKIGPDAVRWETATPEDRQVYIDLARRLELEKNPEVFTGGHFPEPNPIVHFRTTDRVGRNGEQLLHIEEIQSDLHQHGAKVGYREKGEPLVDFNAIDAERTALLKEKNQLVPSRSIAEGERYNAIRARERELTDLYSRGLKQPPLANFPFKTSWQELAVKRILRLAADEGYDGVSISNGDQVGLRVLNPDKVRGVRENYDRKIPALLDKWAKKMGMDIGETKFADATPQAALEKIPFESRRSSVRGLMKENGFFERFNDRNKMVLLNPAAGSRIRQGFPLYEEPLETRGGVQLNQAIQKGTPKEMKAFVDPLTKILGQLGKDLKISKPIEFVIAPRRTSWRGQASYKNGKYLIEINTRLLSRFEDMYATAAHELGHIIKWDKFTQAPEHIRIQIIEAHRRFREGMALDARTVGDVRRIRDNAISEMTGGRNLDLGSGKMSDTVPLSDLTPRSRAYILHFEEWFSEQVAKWATTSEKPLSRVDKFYKAVGDTIRKLIERFRGERVTKPEAIPLMQEWLDSLIGDRGKFGADQIDQLDLNTKRRNADALDKDGTPEVPAVPATASTVGGRGIIDSLGTLAPNASGASAAHADRFNRFYEWMTSLPQIADLNKHIRPLQIYKEIVALMNLEKNNVMGEAWERLKQWKAIRNADQQVGIGKAIDDYMNGHFKLVDDGLIRRPTVAEQTALFDKHKLSPESRKLFTDIVRDFDAFLERYRALLLADAYKIKDPTAQTESVARINERVDALLDRPFMPAMRFGKYTVTVYDSAGNVRHFETTESLRKQRQIKEALEKSSNFLPGDRVRIGEVPKDAAPLLGMPPGLIDLIADKLTLSASQRGVLDQLRFDYAPSQSFRHQFRQKDLTPGYSTDFQRAYAHFFFHGANHITRVKWVDALRDQIRDVKTGSIELDNANKRDAIANYMTEHLRMLVDPKPDFAALRALMFHWYLGFNPASATLNLSQTPLMTFPHLASKFGDFGAVQAILKAGSDLNNFYKKGNLVELARKAPPGPAGSAMRALGEAVKEGVISETQAHTLAAVSEGRNLLRRFGSKTEEGWHNFSEASSWMFEMAEQYNRRVAFRAAWELAMRDPNSKYVTQTVADNPLQYKRLLDQGFSHQEAAAFVAAKDSVSKTQFDYAPYARPKFMWGRKGSLFIFKSFVQNTLFNLWSNPSMAARHLLILGALGGVMGLPGTEDINGILKALAWHLFNKDFDLEDHARKFAIDVLDGNISPDMLLHGTSVKGFGIPHVLNALGGQVGLPKIFPTTDRHSSLSMGNLLPFEPGKAFGPSKDVKASEIQQLQRASGAGFSNIFAMYSFLQSQDSISDLKRWEQIMPRAAGNVSHAWRYFREGEERNRAGNAVVRFDPNDTEHMSEILARALGYQPRRLTAAWEAIAAKQEQATYWDLRRGILLRQFGTAVKGQNAAEREAVLEAVKKYNRELPEEARAKAINSQTLKDSVYQRLRVQKQQESGLPTSKSNYELFKSLDKYFPEGRPTGQIDARPVR